MNVSNSNSVAGNQAINKVVSKPIQKEIAADAPKQLPIGDRVELSGVAGMLKTLKTNDIRADKVASVRAQIEAGTYEDDHKLDVASDRLLDDLLK